MSAQHPYCIYDNPSTGRREVWVGGEIVISFANELIHSLQAGEMSRYSPISDIGPWKKGRIVGDPAAMSSDHEVGGVVESVPMCGRCYAENVALFSANCKEYALLNDLPLGQYHCPDCGAMIVAGFKHPQMCKLCIDRMHPGFDRLVSGDQS